MRKVALNIYGEGTRVDAYTPDDNLEQSYSALTDYQYEKIMVYDNGKETEYSMDDLGDTVNGGYWPEDVYDENEEKFIDPAYAQYEGKSPSEVFDFGGCDLYEAEDEGLERIEYVQTKISVSCDIELKDDEKFDPKKLHLMYAEFVVPGAELEVNTGVVYDGKKYDFEIESERERDTTTLWEA